MGLPMKKRRITALLLAVLMLLSCFAIPAMAAGGITLTLSDSIPEGEQPSLGDTVTYTVTISENDCGFCVGTFYFLPSDNLQYESATLLGEEVNAKPALSGDNQGAYGIVYLETNAFTERDVVLCTMTFRIVGLEEAVVQFYPYQLTDSSLEAVTVQVMDAENRLTIAKPDTPSVQTENLKDAVMGTSYSAALEADTDEFISWELTGGTLPMGLELLNDGTITGVPEEFGDFTFSVTVSVLDTLISEEKMLTLTVLEKPQRLTLTDSSSYTIEGDYLRGVTAGTTLTDVLANFQTPETIRVTDAAGAPITDPQALVGTGCSVQLWNGEEAVHTLTVVVLGDVGGDGEIGTNDYVQIRAHYLEKLTLEGAYLLAARVTGQETVGSGDYVRVRAHYLEKLDLYA